MAVTPVIQQKLSGNALRLYLLAFFQMFLLVIPIAVPFVQSRGLSMQEFFTLQAIFGAAIVIGEVPSGYMADLFGRRVTLILGTLFLGIGHTLLLFADNFWWFLGFEICLGIGASLVSGADLAILYDTKHLLGASPVVQQRSVGNLFFVRSSSEALSALLCSLLLIWSMDLVIAWQAAIGWLPLILALSLVEPPIERLGTQSHWDNFRSIGYTLIFESRLMRLIVMSLAFWGLASFYALWLLQKYWENIGVPLIWFGYLWSGLVIISGLSGRYADRIERWLKAPLMLLLVGALPVLGYLGMAWTDSLISLIFAVFFFVARGLGLVALQNALNRRVPSLYRATANSLANFGFRGGFVLTGPIVGWVLDIWGLQTVFYLAAGFALLVLFLIILPLAWSVWVYQRAREPLRRVS